VIEIYTSSETKEAPNNRSEIISGAHQQEYKKPDDIDPGAIYVAKTGTDEGPGTVEAPYLTIAQGIAALPPGGTLYIREGKYRESVCVSEAKNGSSEIGQTVISAYPGEKAMITGDGGSITMTGCMRYITLEGLTLVGGNYGIECLNSCALLDQENVFILNNTIRNIDGKYSIGIFNQNAVELHSLKNLKIIGNHISGGRCGNTAAIALNGNIDGFEVSGNIIRNNNNTAICLTGYKGGSRLKVEANRVRNGVVFDNTCYGTTVINNPENTCWNNREELTSQPFGGVYERRSAGIYVNGGRSIEIYNNVLVDNDIGIEVASECPVTSSTMNKSVVCNVQVHDNIVIGSSGWTGLCFGSYEGNLAYTQDCGFYNNIFYGNKVGIGVQKSRKNKIYGNIIMGGVQAIEYMSLMKKRPASGDTLLIATLPGANEFGANVWYNSYNADKWDDGLLRMKEIDPAQFSLQNMVSKSPLANPDDGDFTRVDPDFGIDRNSMSEQIALFTAYSEARTEVLKARTYLERKKFDFISAGAAGNLNVYLTDLLKAAGFRNSQVLYVTRTALTNADGLGLNDGTGGGACDLGSIVTKAIGPDNGEINTAILNSVFDSMAEYTTKEYAFIVQVVTWYDSGDFCRGGGRFYTSEATESNMGGVRMFITKTSEKNYKKRRLSDIASRDLRP